jgi:hypothetical protein
LELRSEGFTQRGLAKVLKIRESTLRYHLNSKQPKDSSSEMPAAQPRSTKATTPSVAEESTTTVSSAAPNPAPQTSTSNFLREFLSDIDFGGLAKRRAARQQQGTETARLNDLICAFANFLAQNFSLEPGCCLRLLPLIQTRLNEAELSRHLPQPLPKGTDARLVLARISPQPHTEYFEQAVYRAVIGLLYLGYDPEERRQILRGLAEFFRSEIQRAESCAE